MELALLVAFLLFWSHRVGSDESHAGAANGKDESEAAAGAGFAQGEVTEFSIDESLFDDEGIIAIGLLGFLRRDAWRARWRRLASSQSKSAAGGWSRRVHLHCICHYL
jgi:hypothetical protein